MIFYLFSDEPHLGAMLERFRATRGRPLARRFRPVSYRDALAARSVPRGTWIFSDLERIGPREAERAARLRRRLDDAGQPVLNHPTRSLRRWELLCRLHDAGVNRYAAWRVADGRLPDRFPVFLRMDSDHRGPRTDLLDGPAAYRRAVAELEDAGLSRSDAIAIEFCNTADADGVFAKYAAFRVGDRIIPRHALFSKHWAVKEPDLLERHWLERELAYVEENPHEAELRALFRRAEIEFGRIDYGIRDGRIQVWEINTHPILPTWPGPGGPARLPVNDGFADRFLAALEALDTTSRGPAVDTGFGRPRRLKLREAVWTAGWRLRRAGRRRGG